MTWSKGTQSGSGLTDIPAGAILSIYGTSGTETLNTRTLQIDGSAVWAGGNNIAMTNGALLNITSGGSLNIQNNQTVTSGGAPMPTINNAGTVTKNTGTGTTTIDPTFNNASTTNVSTGTLALTGGGNGAGTFALASGTTLVLGGGTAIVGSVTGSGTVDFSAGTTIFNGTFNAPAGVNVLPPASVYFLANATTGPFNNAGYVDIGTGTVFTASGPPYMQTGGETDLDGATMITPGGVDIAAGVFSGSGTVNTPQFTNDGILSVGGAGYVGVLTINGSFTQGPSRTLVFDVGGPVPGTQYSQLVIIGMATLAGTLDIFGVGTYVPPPGMAFMLITYSSFIGVFPTVNVNINGARLWAISYNPTNVMITVT